MNYCSILFFFILTSFCDIIESKSKLGIVGKKWEKPLAEELQRRSLNADVEVISVTELYSNTLNDIIKEQKFLQDNGITHLIGEFSTSFGISTNALGIPYFVLETCHGTTVSSLALNNIIRIPLTEKFYAWATMDLLKYHKAKQIAVIVIENEADEYQFFLRPFLNFSSFYSKFWLLTDLSMDLSEEAKKILLKIREEEIKFIVIRGNHEAITIFMTQARQLAMVANPYSWLIPSMVCQDFGFQILETINCNLTFLSENCSMPVSKDTKAPPRFLMDMALHELQTVNFESNPALLKQKLSQLTSTSSNFTYDKSGQRNTANIEIVALQQKSLKQIGKWTLDKMGRGSRLQIFPVKRNYEPDNITYMRVVVLEEHPHLIRLKNGSVVGFGVDLVQKISDMLNFTFDLYFVDKFGVFENGSWTGMVNELLMSRADMTMGPLVQSSEMEDVIDFTTTFKQREISLVMRKVVTSPSFFQFLGPFGMKIWICVVAAMVILTVLLYFVERISASNNGRRKAKFNMKECSWFIVAVTMQGGTETVPRSIPGRILVAAVYFFVLIVISSYTANLAAFLTVKATNNAIESVEQLARLPSTSNIKFGTVQGSGVIDFFKHSDILAFKQIYEIMAVKNPSWLVNSSQQGYSRAKNEEYVFIWDDSVNQYEVYNEEEYECALTVIGRPFGKRSFAIGLPQGSIFKERLDKSILELVENGIMYNIDYKWWKSKVLCPTIETEEFDESQALTVHDVAGVFLVLVGGCITSILALGIETIVVRLCKKYRKQRERRQAHEAQHNHHNHSSSSSSSSDCSDHDAEETIALQEKETLPDDSMIEGGTRRRKDSPRQNNDKGTFGKDALPMTDIPASRGQHRPSNHKPEVWVYNAK